MRSVITGAGHFVPAMARTNDDFVLQEFYDDRGQLVSSSTELIEKFEKITGIAARRYASTSMNASDMAVRAAACAIEDSGIDPETIDQVIVAHNFGDTRKHNIQSDVVPALASRVKRALAITNPGCVAYDLLFGCPGWVQGLIHADAFFKAGVAKKCLVIGTETLSRVIDQYDRDSMLFSDGAGAVVVEARPDSPYGAGILGAVAQSHCLEEGAYINMGRSNFPSADPGIRYLKMQGRKVYEFALKTVPEAMKACLEISKIQIDNVKKIFIHQANEKMDAAIIKAFYQLFNRNHVPDLIMPMNIRELGNSSVATIPTLFDMVRRGILPGHRLQAEDIILFASVGAGMNINAVCYRL